MRRGKVGWGSRELEDKKESCEGASAVFVSLVPPENGATSSLAGRASCTSFHKQIRVFFHGVRL